MPSAASKKSRSHLPNSFDEPVDQPAEKPYTVAKPRNSKNKGGNVASNQIHIREESVEEEVAEDEPVSLARPQSILGQIPHAFGRHRDETDRLDAAPTTEKVSDQFSTRTEEWSQQVPYGKSPPEEPKPSFGASCSPPMLAGLLGTGGFSTRTPPVSPRQRQARPVSYGGGPPSSLSWRHGPEQYPYPPTTYGSPPAPPHVPQQHFYAAQDVDLGLGQAPKSAANSELHFVSFSQIPGLDKKHPSRATTSVLRGSDDRIDVLSVQNSKSALIGALYDLPGAVVDAKVLTWKSGDDPMAEFRPLIALVLHGHKQTENDDRFTEQWDEDRPRSVARGQAAQTGIQAHTQYQTTVEIYSLSKRKHIETLLKMPPVSAESMYGGKFYAAPKPSGCLRLATAGNYLTIASGSSGELFVLAILPEGRFECLGKFWTTIQPQAQRRDSSHGRSPDADISPADLNRGFASEMPICSMSYRWLAFCPAPHPSRPSVQAALGTEVVQNRLSGLNMGSAPVRPSILCDVDSPDADTLLGKVVRGVTQQAMKGAGWVFDQGMQAFNSYWRKEQPSSLSPRGTLAPQTLSPLQPATQNFPPTHALETQSSSREPDLISIIDLKALERSPHKKQGELPKPLVTFQPPGGCSYLSFAPNGLSILSASRKGDLHYVWDLMQAKYHRVAAAVAETIPPGITSSSPRVRQVAKFPRYTSSTVVDIIWAPWTGERFAVVTKNGTIHLYDMPVNSFRWPPPRRAKKTRPTSAPVDPAMAGDSTSGTSSTSSGFLASAINLAGRTQPILANLRGRAPSLGGGVGAISGAGVGLASATGARSGRALASGFSKSLGAASGTVTQMRLAGEGRIHLKSLANDPSGDRIAWSVRGSKSTLMVLDKSAVRSYTVLRAATSDRQTPRTSIFEAKKPTGSKLPSLSTLVSETQELQNVDLAQRPAVDDPEQLSGFWPSVTSQTPTSQGLIHPLAYAEIESNAPYQPFHSDPRVNLFVHLDRPELDESHLPTVSAVFGPATWAELAPSSNSWIFGTAIPGTKLNLQAYQNHEVDEVGDKSVMYRETAMTPKTMEGTEDTVEQIVTTTRRRKAQRIGGTVDESNVETNEEGFFEDDCDVLDFAGDRV